MSQEMRTIITIDDSLCNGCGICVSACHEGAIGLVEGKARLLHEHYCDGLGSCLPSCPTGAITFEKRLAEIYDEAAVLAARAVLPQSELHQWPIQIKLVGSHASFFEGADVLIAADCTAFAYEAFHRDFMAGKVALIGCPKLDSVDYADKLGHIVANNNIASVTVARMEVPCCGGIEAAAKKAIAASGKNISLHIATITTDGALLG